MAVTINGSAGVTTNTGAVYNGLQTGTAVASTSGTAIDFTGIPSWVKRITVMFSGVSTNGTANIILQLGTSSGVENSGYSSMVTAVTSTNNTTRGLATTSSFYMHFANAATETLSGNVVLSLLGSNAWTCNGLTYQPVSVSNCSISGIKTTASTLDRVRITTTNGTDTFDAGTINIIYE